MPVHPDTASVEQDRTAGAVADRLVEGSTDRGWQWNEDGLAAFAQDPEHAVAVLFAEVGDVGRYPVQQAGGRTILEYWIPADDLPELNANLVGPIEVTAEYH